VLEKGPTRLLAGYSRVFDEADLIAPWRGFPTGGYTRTMAQYNWQANTDSWMVKVAFDFGRAGVVRGLRAVVDYVVMDYDDEKERLGGHLRTDRSVVHADVWYRFRSAPFLEAKVRVGLVDADRPTVGRDHSYDEVRFELNWLF
jgi:hypothetical protein